MNFFFIICIGLVIKKYKLVGKYTKNYPIRQIYHGFILLFTIFFVSLHQDDTNN